MPSLGQLPFCILLYIVFFISLAHTIRYFIYLPAHLNYENNYANSSHFVVNICYVVDPHDNSATSQHRGDCASKRCQRKTTRLVELVRWPVEVRSDQVREYIYLYCIAPQQNGCHRFVCRLFEPRGNTHTLCGGLCVSGWPIICLSQGCLIRPGECNRTAAYMCVCVTYDRNTQINQ